jgi:Rrf2 family iron-sulfur cluster assembly transcriptional regulator
MSVPHMKDSSKARYAVSALVDLAFQPAHQPTTLAAIAKRQDISVSYLEQLFAKLRAGGLIKSVRGPGGGYVLARPSRDITIADIYEAVYDPSENPPSASDLPGQGPDLKSHMRGLWSALDLEMAKFLKSITVQDILSGRLSTPKAATIPAQ